MKTIGLSFLVILAGCVNKSHDTKTEENPSGLNDTIVSEITDEEISDADEDSTDSATGDEAEGTSGGYVCVSEDGKVTIESGIYEGGGTAPDYWAEWTIVGDNGKKRKISFNYSSYHDRVHAIHKNDGSTYYLVSCSAKTSSAFTDEWLEAYRIVGDSIWEVNITDGDRKRDEYGFHISYDIPGWYFATNGEGYDWIFEYDPATQNLYVPLVDDEEILDRYDVWHFNGDRFVHTGHQPHKGLHDSLAKYNRLISSFNTKDYIIRIDSLDSRELRYASWKRPKTIAEKPDIIITGGKREEHYAAPDELKRCDDYRFTKDGYEYIVNYCETKLISHGFGEHHDFLLVKKGDKIILKQPEKH